MASACCAADVSCVRDAVVICAEHGLEGDELDGFMLGVGGAITNAIKHAPKGDTYAGRVDNSIWVGVVDNGPGISSLLLPRAALYRGFSNQTSIGSGILDYAKRV